jgi:hypothetical protein
MARIRATDEQLQDIIDGHPQKMRMYEVIAEELQERRYAACKHCVFSIPGDNHSVVCGMLNDAPFHEDFYCAEFQPRT